MKPQPALAKPPAPPVERKPEPPKTAARRRERIFYTGLAVAIAITIVAGFARTYYLRPLFDATSLPPLLHLHGAIFSAWLAVYVAQTVLVAANRTRVHRRLGMAGAGLAAAMVVVGVVTAVIRAKQGAAPPGIDPLVFLVVPLGDMLVFATLVAAGISSRRRPDVHKRLMALAMVSILSAAIARLPYVLDGGPLAFFGGTDLFVAACAIYDVVALGRVHRATLWGGLLIVVSQPARLLLGSTTAWMAFATWVTSWAG
jgi:hypothetical protein